MSCMLHNSCVVFQCSLLNIIINSKRSSYIDYNLNEITNVDYMGKKKRYIVSQMQTIRASAEMRICNPLVS